MNGNAPPSWRGWRLIDDACVTGWKDGHGFLQSNLGLRKRSNVTGSMTMAYNFGKRNSSRKMGKSVRVPKL
jgi:hypothetical protein